jgi:hypothetical protein
VARDLLIEVIYKPTLDDIEKRGKAAVSGSKAFFAEKGAELKARVQELTPFRTGFLRGHVRVVYFGNQTTRGFEVGWYYEDFASRGYPPYYLYIEFGTSGRNATPSLGPAWARMEPLLAADLENSFLAYYAR